MGGTAPQGAGGARAEGPACAVVLDIGGTKVAGALAVLCGPGEAPRLAARRTVPTEAARGGADLLARACALAAGLSGEARAEGLRPVGVGASSAGSIRESDGLVAFANDVIPGWRGQPLGAALAEACGLPSAVLNDVHAHALGELRHGAARGARTALMVAAGTGLGGAVIVDGRVLGGAHGFAGALGHTIHPAAVGVPSAWPGTGHVESVVSGSGIEACYRLRSGDAVPASEVARRAEAGEPLAREVVELAGRTLGESIVSWADVVDPELVVLSGSVCKAGPLWRAALAEGMASFASEEMRGLRVVDAELGGDAPLVGAAERLLDRLREEGSAGR